MDFQEPITSIFYADRRIFDVYRYNHCSRCKGKDVRNPEKPAVGASGTTQNKISAAYREYLSLREGSMDDSCCESQDTHCNELEFDEAVRREALLSKGDTVIPTTRLLFVELDAIPANTNPSDSSCTYVFVAERSGGDSLSLQAALF